MGLHTAVGCPQVGHQSDVPGVTLPPPCPGYFMYYIKGACATACNHVLLTLASALKEPKQFLNSEKGDGETRQPGLVSGGSGTDQELLALALQREAFRKRKPYLREYVLKV